jgi:hypothetical protein
LEGGKMKIGIRRIIKYGIFIFLAFIIGTILDELSLPTKVNIIIVVLFVFILAGVDIFLFLWRCSCKDERKIELLERSLEEIKKDKK